MKEKVNVFTVNGKEYKIVFNLNVMQIIQAEYGTFEKWGQLTDGYVYDENGEKIQMLDSQGIGITEKIKNENDEEVEVPVFETREVDIKALIFGIKEALNEAIDIENEENNTNKPLLNDKQVGRLITAMGIKKMTAKLTETVVNSVDDGNQKNE